MANKTFSFRLPEELICALEERARFLGKTKTNLIVDALTQAYDLSPPASSAVPIASIQQQLAGLKQQITALEEHQAIEQTEHQETLMTLTAVLDQVMALRDLCSVQQAEIQLSQVIGVVRIAFDIIYREQAKLTLKPALQQSLQSYRDAFEQANDMIIILDADSHQIIDANLKASCRLRYTRADLCQLNVEDIETPESAGFFQSVIIPRLKKTDCTLFNHSLRRQDGAVLPVEISMCLMSYGNRLVYQSIARDVSAPKKLAIQDDVSHC